MRLLSFRRNGRASYGAATSDGIVDLGTSEVSDLRTALCCSALADLAKSVERAEQFLAVDSIEWLPPVPFPEKILCVGYNYRKHLEELGTALPNYPSIFVRFPGAQVGHQQPIVRPKLSEMYDFEGELAVVIGREGRHIAPEAALEHVAGYSCFADNSVRDYQRHSGQATAGKNFEQSGSFGPWIVTRDEIPDPAVLTLTTRLNGEEMQRSSLDDLIFPVPELIAYISRFTRLMPGDVIATGTPSGVGLAREPKLWMKPGDVLEIEIDRIGTLRNKVIDEA